MIEQIHESFQPSLQASLTRRRLLHCAALAPVAVAASRVLAPRTAWAQNTPAPAAGKHTLPPLPYAHDALEPHIDTMTMQIHHGKHHQAYVDKLNAALEKHPALQGKSAEDLIRNLDMVPAEIRTAVQNNAGGHVNHSMFWAIMKPQGGGQPGGPVADGIMKKWGSFDAFTKEFNDAGVNRFGSGWAWLAVSKNGLHVMSTANQDNPLMVGHFPVLGNDVWEHAYYLKYQNRRADYLKAWWNVVNWDEVNRRYSQSMTMNVK